VFNDAAVMNSSGLSDGELWKFKFKKPYNSTHCDCRLLLLLLLLLLTIQTSSSSSKHAYPAVAASSFVGGLLGFDAKLTDEVAAVQQFAAASASASARQLQAGFAEPAPGANLCVPRSQNFTVSTTAEADAAAAGIRCNGGRFNVYIKGHVMVNSTFSLPTGNTLYMFADGADAVMDGGGSVQLMKGAPGSYISLTGLRLQGGFSLSGGGAVGSPAGRVDAKGCTFFNNSALAGNNTIPLHLKLILLRTTALTTLVCCCTCSDDAFSGGGGAVEALVAAASNCSFIQNTACLWGAGLNAFAVLELNSSTFISNTAGTCIGGALGPGIGGALLVHDSGSRADIRDCSFHNNTGTLLHCLPAAASNCSQAVVGAARWC
jgi:hypothetical protein